MFSFFISSPFSYIFSFSFSKNTNKKKTKKQIPPKKNNKELKGNVLYIFLFFTTLLLVFPHQKKYSFGSLEKNNIVYEKFMIVSLIFHARYNNISYKNKYI